MKALPSCRFRIPPGPQSRCRKLPLVGQVLDDVVSWFSHHGYTQSTIRKHINGLPRLVRWLQRRRGPDLNGLTQLDLRSAYDWFRRREPGVAGTTRALERFLRERQFIREAKAPRPPASERELEIHGAYLKEVRGLTDSTIQGHQSRLRSFLRFLRFDEHPCVLRTLRMDQIEAFLRKAAKTNSRFSLQNVVASVRGILRRKHAQTVLKRPLHQHIDTPRTYRLERLPRALPWEQVIALLRSIDRSRPDGLRDFTLLYLAARYGLRSGELVRLTLDDINWRTGILRVPQSKTRQTLELPLTEEAGDVLARYLKNGRPGASIVSCSCAAGHRLVRWPTLRCTTSWNTGFVAVG
jgi:site-specific recombinase XerD